MFVIKLHLPVLEGGLALPAEYWKGDDRHWILPTM